MFCKSVSHDFRPPIALHIHTLHTSILTFLFAPLYCYFHYITYSNQLKVFNGDDGRGLRDITLPTVASEPGAPLAAQAVDEASGIGTLLLLFFCILNCI